MKKIKIGIIGCGGIANFHAKGYLQDERCEIVCVCDINKKRAEDFAKKYAVEKFYASSDEMFKENKIDAVSICTYNSAHALETIKALKRNINVLCEKPMARTYKEALDMYKAYQESQALLMIGFVRRFGNDAEVIKDFIDNGYFGDIYYSKAVYLRRNGCPGGWFGEKEISGGGPLIDLGVHVIDLVRYFMGLPKAVSVYGATYDKIGERENIKDKKAYIAADSGDDIFDVEDLATCMIRFENGQVLHVETSFSLNIKKEVANIELFGTKAGCRLDPTLEMYTQQNGYLVNIEPDMNTALSFDGLFESEVTHFIDCVKDGIECKSPAEDGLEIMKIIDGAYRSAKIMGEVKL